MPYAIRTLVNRVAGRPDAYQVYNTITGRIHAYHTTKAKAEAQIRLLHSKEHEIKYGTK